MALGIASVISSVSESIKLVGKAKEIAERLKYVELKTTIAELANKLADANTQLAELEEDEIRQLERREHFTSREKAKPARPKMKWGCYMFDGDERLYCPGCYDTKGKKHVTTRVNSNERRCTVCQSVLGI